ncbi:hypothetical protein QBC35DRAFT_66850 [Podospora australis]|uniref:Calcium permeable stress-gated cation channel 1 n=1 Tax=Podospora australis TaxID=1536484 RepID=A0AAN6WLL2_9PEZI|nr:hypothetical protein QBC35DRAFT_66850 [Podospora australis]
MDMDIFEDHEKNKCSNGTEWVRPNATDTKVQLSISLALGISAFLAFCVLTLRPRWKSLYAARKQRLDASIALPVLPDTFFGWMPALYKITEHQVLASAGLDAYVFLTFFKMSMKLFGIMLFFAAVVLEPINRHYIHPDPLDGDGTDPDGSSSSFFRQYPTYSDYGHARLFEDGNDGNGNHPDESWNKGYLWSYLVFAYFFTALTLYIMDKETLKVIRVRQDYLGTQSTITDRTFRLSGIPKELRTEAAIKELVEKLEIGKVECVNLCRNWKEIDGLMTLRETVLAKLEESWSVYVRQKPRVQARAQPNGNGTPSSDVDSLPRDVDEEAADENDRLLRAGVLADRFPERERPQTRLWYGFLRLQSRKTDAIDYYSERLRLLDEKIIAARKKTFEPADLAFVTMDSIAACQMAIQALIDPRPGTLKTKPAPAPSDVIWDNTYKPRLQRRVRSWVITLFVSILSIIWLVPVAALASTLSLCTISSVFPSFGESLKQHPILRSLIQTGLPTATVSLLNVAVPYVYDFLSYRQGMISRGDVALSVVSKNFFFTFFNVFLIFTVFSAVTEIIPVLRNSIKDTTYIAYTLARKIENLSVFYTNFIMLQGLGLFPFRLLEFGSVALYPILRMGAKTPRDFAQIAQPPMFYYGFYLPTSLLVFILCLVYSALPNGYQVLGLGLAYFSLGYYTYKYQLLYAMDQPQHATGGAWRMICYRITLGLLVFQLTMSGYLALRSAYTVALLLVPLFIATVWYSWSFRQQFEPLTRFISLRSIKQQQNVGASAIMDDDLDGEGEVGREVLRRGSTVDEDREKGLRFVNPNLVVPLQQPWIYRDPPPPFTEENDGLEFALGRSEGIDYDLPPSQQAPFRNRPSNLRPELAGDSLRGGASSGNSASSVSLGDTHIWRD